MAMTVRLTEKEDIQLTDLAKIWGVSKQQAVVRAVDEAYGAIERKAKIEVAIEETLDRYGDLLRRLGE